MSVYTGYWCRTCDTESQAINGGVKALQLVAQHHPDIDSAFRAADQRDRLNVHFIQQEHIPAFLTDHAGHDIALRNEFGQVTEVSTD